MVTRMDTPQHRPAHEAPDWEPLWLTRFKRVFSFRVLFYGGLGVLVIAWLLSKVWEPLIYLGWPLFVAYLVGTWFNDDVVLRCPHCRKRTKLDATVCPRCGRDLVNRSREDG
jgi:hypothetical protein